MSSRKIPTAVAAHDTKKFFDKPAVGVTAGRVMEREVDGKIHTTTTKKHRTLALVTVHVQSSVAISVEGTSGGCGRTRLADGHTPSDGLDQLQLQL